LAREDALQRNTSDAGDVPSDGPVGKVVKLLEDMRVELLKEKERDQELYDKLSCWCEETRGSKEAAIESGTAAIDRLAADIQAKASKTYQLKPEIKFLKEDLADSEKSLRESEEMRSTERAEFSKNEKELASAITSLNGAVAAMAKAHPSFLAAGGRGALAFIQEALTEADGSLQRSLAALSPRLLWHSGLTEDQRGQLNAFLQHRSPGSEVVFGILKQMKETFETNLADAQASEAESASDFLKLKASKSKELNAGRQNLAAKEQDLAATTEEMAAAEQNRDDTEATVEADTKALLSAKKRCKAADEEFEERHKSRSEELAAISDTIALLTSPDAANLFGKTLNFLQVSSKRSRRAAALRSLQALKGRLTAASRRSGRRALAAVAAKVKGLDAMEKVLEGVNKMITELEIQQKDHTARKDECDTQIAENEAATDATDADLKDLDSEVASLEETLAELNDDLAGLEAEMNETQGEIKAAGEDRAAENADYNNAVANQHATQQVLQMAVNRMQLVYDFLQQTRPLSLAAAQHRSKGGGGAVKMLQEIIEDSKAMVKDAEATEKKAQEGYADFVKQCNDALKVTFASMTDKKMKRGKGEAELIQTKEAQSSATKELSDLKQQADTLKSACESLVKNFDTVQQARADEIDALRQSLDILSEAAPGDSEA
jgi:chromosome segregation ATPase